MKRFLEIKYWDSIEARVNLPYKKFGALNRVNRFFNNDHLLNVYRFQVSPTVAFGSQIWTRGG